MERRKELRFQPSGLIEVFVLGEGEAGLTGQVIDTSERGLSLHLPSPLPPGTSIKIEADDALLLGEVSHCEPQDAWFRVGVVVKHRLAGLAELHRLNRALHADAVSVARREHASPIMGR